MKIELSTSELWRKIAALVTALLFIGSAPTQLWAGDHDDFATKTPIKHIVVIFQENVSFDHYFATYPNSANPAGEPQFHALPGTPSVNGLTEGLLDANPNGVRPMRLDRSQNYTCDMDHDYTAEQQAFDNGVMDKFQDFTATPCTIPNEVALGKSIVLGYYDGNTVTAIWNYAQHFAMNDNSFGTTFGPSTPGALNLVAGQTAGVDSAHTTGNLTGTVENNVDISDADPFYDDCSGSATFAITGQNVGDLLNAQNITWGWFQGGFAPTANSGGKSVCGASTKRLDGTVIGDYSAHHEPFQYYAQTSNPHHLPPTSLAMVGRTDQANHQYDLSLFFKAAASGNLPAVSFLKAKKAGDGHAGYSSPLDEQEFLVTTLNFLQSLPEWKETLVVISYDDSDGWYDHQMGPIVNQSAAPADALTGPGACGTGTNSLGGFPDRCGYGPRLPLLVISPFAKQNFVDNTLTDQSSILRFIEDNWGLGQLGGGSFDAIAGPITNMLDFSHPSDSKLFLDPVTGRVVANQDK